MRALGHDESLSARQISRPWDVGRTGFVLSEGAAVVVLEEHDHAHRRNAPILGEVVGFGQSADAGDLVAPEPSGAGPVAAMRAALRDAGWQPNDIDWINAHATGTPHGDDVELDAIEQVFGDRDAERPLFVSSSKGLTGHLLGASGALQAVLGLEALRHDIVPPNTNLVTPSRLSRFHLPVEPVKRPLSTFMLNSFGFGGVNGCLAIGKEV
ncbi:beta-ketoacyl-[acyl-carrier-protein] synthase family protein [Asaia lannensis]|uniref:beta-ketoacyl-[acyl-carrier-protein] synthase family protein n=1 Tax=Asaia lannensis TaxID=415421 RepID=UPI0038736444